MIARLMLVLLFCSFSSMAQEAAWPGGVAKIDLGQAAGDDLLLVGRGSAP